MTQALINTWEDVPKKKDSALPCPSWFGKMDLYLGVLMPALLYHLFDPLLGLESS